MARNLLQQFAGGGGRRPTREPGYGNSVFVRVTGVDTEANTLSGVVTGGLRHGEEIEGVAFTGKTKPRALTKKGMSYIPQEDIESGKIHMAVDGLRKNNEGKLTASWMRKAGEHVEYSSPSDQKYMAIMPLKSSWEPEDEGDPEIRKHGVLTLHTGGGAEATSVEQFKENFIAAAGGPEGFGAVHVAMRDANGERRDKRNFAVPGEDGARPTAEQRFEQIVASVGGPERLEKALESGYKVSTTPATLRILSKFETNRLVENSNVMGMFEVAGHGRRLLASVRGEQNKEKVSQAFMGWVADKGFQAPSLQEAEDRVVARFARDHGVTLPPLGRERTGFLPAALALHAPDNEEMPPFVSRVLPTSTPVPASFMPVAGDENAPARYYKTYSDAAQVLTAAPDVQAKAAEIAEQKAAEQEAEAAAEEAEAEEGLEQQMDELLEGLDDDGEDLLPDGDEAEKEDDLTM